MASKSLFFMIFDKCRPFYDTACLRSDGVKSVRALLFIVSAYLLDLAPSQAICLFSVKSNLRLIHV